MTVSSPFLQPQTLKESRLPSVMLLSTCCGETQKPSQVCVRNPCILSALRSLPCLPKYLLPSLGPDTTPPSPDICSHPCAEEEGYLPFTSLAQAFSVWQGPGSPAAGGSCEPRRSMEAAMGTIFRSPPNKQRKTKTKHH